MSSVGLLLIRLKSIMHLSVLCVVACQLRWRFYITNKFTESVFLLSRYNCTCSFSILKHLRHISFLSLNTCHTKSTNSSSSWLNWLTVFSDWFQSLISFVTIQYMGHRRIWVTIRFSYRFDSIFSKLFVKTSLFVFVDNSSEKIII